MPTSALSRNSLLRGPKAWKDGTFLIGLLLLLAGAWYGEWPDWDYAVSLLMAGSTYLTAQWSVTVLMERRYAWWPLAGFYAWLSVDGLYAVYWELVNPAASIREGQWMASLCLYLLCGFVWRFDPRELLRLQERVQPE